MKVLFIGSNPSKASRSMIPFSIDTKSGRTFHQWICVLLSNLDTYRYNITNVVNRTSDNNRPLKISEISDVELQQVRESCANYTRVVAIGSFASNILKKLKINHFKLPHPSPRNRQLNDPDFIVKQLELCQMYLT